MPHSAFPITPQGPLIQMLVGVSGPRKQALLAAGQAVPAAIAAHLLVDTGASGTSIDKSIISQLGIPATGSVNIHTPSTGSTPLQCSMYDVELAIAGGHNQHIPLMPVVESDFSAQGIQGLLGRDFLQYGRMMYCGDHAHVFISF